MSDDAPPPKAAAELSGWKADDVERGQRLATHRVHVGQRVSGSDLSEGVWVVDDRREEVHRLHEGKIIGQDEDAGVVERFATDDQTRIEMDG